MLPGLRPLTLSLLEKMPPSDESESADMLPDSLSQKHTAVGLPRENRIQFQLLSLQAQSIEKPDRNFHAGHTCSGF